MKKIVAMLLVLAVLAMSSAFAAEVSPLEGIILTGMPEGILSVSFTAEDIEDDGSIYIKIYEVPLYDMLEVNRLEVGDKILFLDEWVDVEAVENDNWINVNGGSFEGGITLVPNEGGTYIPVEYECPVYVQIGSCAVALADEVTYSHWTQNEAGQIQEEMETVTVSAEEMLAYVVEENSFYPAGTTVTIENGVITEITVNYVP